MADPFAIPRAVSLALSCLAAGGCFAPTTADDPLPGPILESAVVADEEQARYTNSSVLIAASPASAASWITDPALLRVWFAEEVDFGAVGEDFRIAWPSQQQEWRGRLLELDAAGRLAAEVRSHKDGAPVRIELDHVEEAGHQRVSIRVGPFGKEMADEVVATGYREGMNHALLTLRRAVAGEVTEPPAVPIVERTFKARETPREGLEAEIKMKDATKRPAPVRKPEGDPK